MATNRTALPFPRSAQAASVAFQLQCFFTLHQGQRQHNGSGKWSLMGASTLMQHALLPPSSRSRRQTGQRRASLEGQSASALAASRICVSSGLLQGLTRTSKAGI